MDTTDRHQDHAAGIVPRPERVNRLANFLAESPDPTGWVVRRLRVATEYHHSSQDIHLLVVELLAALDRVGREQIEQLAADHIDIRTTLDYAAGKVHALADDLVRMGLMPEAGAR